MEKEYKKINYGEIEKMIEDKALEEFTAIKGGGVIVPENTGEVFYGINPVEFKNTYQIIKDNKINELNKFIGNFQKPKGEKILGQNL